MNFFQKLVGSTVGKKFLMSITGIALTLFLAGHLVGNMQLLLPDHGHAFNRYAHLLTNLGELLIAVELGLIACFAVHISFALQTWNISRKARTEPYAMEVTKGGDSKSNISSKNMLIFGLFALVFVVLHIAQFKYGLFDKDPRTINYNGVTEVRDLYYLVVSSFQSIGWVLAYTILLGGIGFHLRHGIWSMLQSIGAMPRSCSNIFYTAALVIALAMFAGFIALPWIVYLVPAFDHYIEAVQSGAIATTQGMAH